MSLNFEFETLKNRSNTKKIEEKKEIEDKHNLYDLNKFMNGGSVLFTPNKKYHTKFVPSGKAREFDGQYTGNLKGLR